MKKILFLLMFGYSLVGFGLNAVNKGKLKNRAEELFFRSSFISEIRGYSNEDLSLFFEAADSQNMFAELCFIDFVNQNLNKSEIDVAVKAIISQSGDNNFDTQYVLKKLSQLVYNEILYYKYLVNDKYSKSKLALCCAGTVALSALLHYLVVSKKLVPKQDEYNALGNYGYATEYELQKVRESIEFWNAFDSGVIGGCIWRVWADIFEHVKFQRKFPNISKREFVDKLNYLVALRESIEAHKQAIV